MVEKIAPQRDSAAIAANIPRILSSLTPRPVYYYNFNVGECKDLIFGVSLVDYATARGLAEGEIPKIVRICIEDIDRRGLEAEGIYRVSRTCDHFTFLILTSFSIVGLGKACGCSGGTFLRRN